MELENVSNEVLGRPTVDSFYDPLFIEQVVKEIQAGLSQKTACIKYNLKRGTLRYWLYGGRYEFKRSKAPAVSATTKRSVVRAIREGRMTVKEAMAAHELKTTVTIRHWMAWEKRENDELAGSKQQEMTKKKTPGKHPADKLSQQEVAALQQALAEEKLRNAALNTLIDVAEEQLKINIRKKPGAKQS